MKVWDGHAVHDGQSVRRWAGFDRGAGVVQAESGGRTRVLSVPMVVRMAKLKRRQEGDQGTHMLHGLSA